MSGHADDDWMTAIGGMMPVSPLSVLGAGLAALVVLRSVADPSPLDQDVVEAVIPLAASLGAVAADRWLVHDGVPPRDRLTVFAFSLGGFLAAALIAGLQLLLLRFQGVGVQRPLFLILVGGTVGVAAGTVAGTAEVRQREAAREARRQRERLETFASIVSHDLRNPLEVAQGYLDTAFETGDPEHLFRVQNALDRMDDLIEESLALARKGRVVEDPEPVDVAVAASEAWDTVRTNGATSSIDTTLIVAADEARLQELLENCFRNAIEHGMPEDADGEEPPLTVTVGTIAGEQGFFVADDGPGIPEDRRENVFDRGHTTAERGTGLGLAIVREIAEAHGWTVAATESESGGARIEIRTS